MLDKYVVVRANSVVNPIFENKFTFNNFERRIESIEDIEIKEIDLTLEEAFDIRRNPKVMFLARSMPMQLAPSVEFEFDPLLEHPAGSVTWGIKATRANESVYDGDGITVAVLDTGINPHHPAFSGIELVTKNFTNHPNDNDTHGHGTHCAGTVFGRDVKGVRIGIAPGIKKALIGKVHDGMSGNTFAVADAIRWAVLEGANIISMSLGADYGGHVRRLMEVRGMELAAAVSIALETYRENVNLFSALASHVQAANSSGRSVILVAGSGNFSNRPTYTVATTPPASEPTVISVAALQKTAKGFDVTRTSNTLVDIAAPGFEIISANASGGLGSRDGTSTAAPHVAGIAALWAQRQLNTLGSIDSNLLTSQLINSGTRSLINTAVTQDDVGTGLVQAPL